MWIIAWGVDCVYCWFVCWTDGGVNKFNRERDGKIEIAAQRT